MTCAEYLRLLDGEDPECPQALAHRRACPACATAFRRRHAVKEAFAAMASEQAPPFLHARIMAGLRSQPRARRSRLADLLGPRPAWAAAAVAAVLMVALGSVGLWEVLGPQGAPAPEFMDALLREAPEVAAKAAQDAAAAGGSVERESLPTVGLEQRSRPRPPAAPRGAPMAARDTVTTAAPPPAPASTTLSEPPPPIRQHQEVALPGAPDRVAQLRARTVEIRMDEAPPSPAERRAEKAASGQPLPARDAAASPPEKVRCLLHPADDRPHLEVLLDPTLAARLPPDLHLVVHTTGRIGTDPELAAVLQALHPPPGRYVFTCGVRPHTVTAPEGPVP